MTSINTNIATTMANSLGSLKLNSATKAFAQAQRPVEEIEQELLSAEIEDRKLIDNKSDKDAATALNKFSPQMLLEMKELSKEMGEELTDEDIQYGLKYGRSVIADYSV